MAPTFAVVKGLAADEASGNKEPAAGAREVKSDARHDA
jgi:hypothetical protein